MSLDDQNPTQPEDVFKGIDRKDIEQLHGLGDVIGTKDAISKTALDNLGVSVVLEMSNPGRPLTPDERVQKEIEGNVADQAQSAKTAGEQILAGRPPGIPKLSRKQKFFRFLRGSQRNS